MAQKVKKQGENVIIRLKSKEKQETLDWINKQTNVSESIRFLIELDTVLNGLRNYSEIIPPERSEQFLINYLKTNVLENLIGFCEQPRQVGNEKVFSVTTVESRKTDVIEKTVDVPKQLINENVIIKAVHEERATDIIGKLVDESTRFVNESKINRTIDEVSKPDVSNHLVETPEQNIYESSANRPSEEVQKTDAISRENDNNGFALETEMKSIDQQKSLKEEKKKPQKRKKNFDFSKDAIDAWK